MHLNELRIFPTKNAPEISFNPNGVMVIKGRSVIVNSNEFSRLIEGWFDDYLRNPSDITHINFHLEYIPTSNLIIYISFLKKLKSAKLKKKRFIINWYYEEGDEDIHEKGEYISTILNIPFNYIDISDPTLYDRNS